jgi:ATP-dependent protease ClpP protease subunit
MTKAAKPILKVAKPQTRPKPAPRSEVRTPQSVGCSRPVAASPTQRERRAALRGNRPAGTITAKSLSPGEGELLLFGSIGEDWYGEGITDKSFNEALQSLGNVNTIRLRINSGGGDVFDATAIYNMLVKHDAQVIVEIEGVAASAATLIAMAGDEIHISENAHFMIHAASGIAWGNAEAMRQYLKLLDDADHQIRLTYSARTGIPVDELVEMMNHDNWMTAQEAFDLGFVDVLDGLKSVTPHVTPNDNAVAASGGRQRLPSLTPERLAAMASNLHSLAASVSPAAPQNPTGSSPNPVRQEKEQTMKLSAKLRAKCVAAGMSDKLTDEEALKWFEANEDAVLNGTPVVAPVQKTEPTPAPVAAGPSPEDIAAAFERLEAAKAAKIKAWKKEVDANIALAFGANAPKDLVAECYELQAEGIDKVRETIQNAKKKADDETPIGGVRFDLSPEQPQDRHMAAIRSGLLVRALNNFKSIEDVKLSTADRLEKHLPVKDRAKGWEDFSRMHLRDVARECLLASGVRYEDVRRLSGPQVAMAALGFHTQAGLRNSAAIHTTGSLAEITRDAVNKSLRAGYDEAPQTWRICFRQGTSVQDFKDIHRVKLGAAGNMPVWNDNMAPEQAKLSNEKEKYAVEARALDLSFSWQLVINDDLDAISRHPQLLGDSAGRTVNAVAWRQITSNPTMTDGQALFLETPTGNRKRKNYTTGSATPTNTTIGAMKALMRVMRGLNTPEGNESEDILNLEPAFLIGPAALEEIILKQVFSGADPASGGNSAVYNSSRTLTPVIEPLLDADSTTAFYLAASPSRIDTVEVTFLEGQETPMAHDWMDQATMAQHFTIIQTFQAKALDHRGLQKHKGAA